LVPDTWDPHIWTEFEVWQIHDKSKPQTEEAGAETDLLSATEVKDRSLQREVVLPKTGWCLTFSTFLSHFKLGNKFRETQTTRDVADVVAYRILDKNDEECGRVQLLST
jgi:hypothetical protein